MSVQQSHLNVSLNEPGTASNNANHVPSPSSPWCDCFLYDFYLKSLKELKAIPMNRLAEVYNLSQWLY
ncbi:hypothetical protein GWI33_001535 [Rhynchophorus ferrugineus]|uniref:Uncharacterized protein n=1 Tax=Rhynchophorus ferrugineus TaxID=354439 RepID=A0A834M1M1_RHYFE|nr:hypothetical protein GWI33_001535 [Rhynchophorus ferrugineus]